MAKTIGSLLSQSASGLFANTLIFRQHPKGDAVYFHIPRKYKGKKSTLVQRFLYGMILADWRICPDNIRLEFHELAKSKPYYGVQAFYKFWFDMAWNSIFDDGIFDACYFH